MDNLIFSTVPLDTLLHSFREVVKEEIKAQQLNDLREKLLSPKEVCNLFTPKISLPTLARWTEQDLLKRYDIGGKVLYKYSEIIESLKTLKKYSTS